MMTMVGAAVAPDTAPASVLGDTWASTDASATRTTDNRHVSTAKIGTDRPFAALHKFVSYRGQTCRVGTLTRMRAVDPQETFPALLVRAGVRCGDFHGKSVRMDTFVTISGCSSGGKSTLLAELRGRGFATIDEPGRRIVAEELERGSNALPWVDAVAFARRAIEVSLADRIVAEARMGWVFFDRGLIDAAAALEHLTGQPVVESLGLVYRYNKRVFLTPPWPEIFALDQERRHGLTEAVAEYDRLIGVYPSLGYEVHVLPKVSVPERANWLLASLAR
jgi:predicted ATPase